MLEQKWQALKGKFFHQEVDISVDFKAVEVVGITL